MKTTQLIDFLGKNVEPVDRRQLPCNLLMSLSFGLAAAVVAINLVLGIRTDLYQSRPTEFVLLKLLFTATVVILASASLLRLERPGGEKTTHLIVPALPIIAISVFAAINLLVAPQTMLIGHEWSKCLISIPLLASLPFAAIVYAVRKGAPTDLRRTGGVAGLAAGALAATAYALHGTGDALPYIALWYGSAISLSALAGALLGPRMLHW